MALPTVEKTWQYNVNQVDAPGASALENSQKLMYRIKTTLTGFATNPWVVLASSNGTVANSSDNWASFNDILFRNGAGTRSWIVLKQTGIASNFQIMISCAASTGPTGRYAQIVASPSAGFTGLASTSADPTATDQYVVNSPSNAADRRWFDVQGAAFQSVVHGMQSSDGEKTRIIVGINANSRAMWLFDKLSNPVTGMTNPSICMVLANAAGSGTTLTHANLSSTIGGVGSDVSTIMTYFLTSEGFSAAGLVTAFFNTNPNQISSEWPITSVGAASTTTGKTGRHGRMGDLWFGSSSGTITDGSTYPSGVSRQFVQFGVVVLPWDGSTPQLS